MMPVVDQEAWDSGWDGVSNMGSANGPSFGDSLGNVLLGGLQYAIQERVDRRRDQWMKDREGNLQQAGDADGAGEVVKTSQDGNKVTLNLPILMLIAGAVFLTLAAKGD